MCIRDSFCTIRSPPLRISTTNPPSSLRPKSARVNQSNKTQVNFSSGEEELFGSASPEFTSTPPLVPKTPKRVWEEEKPSKDSGMELC